MSYCNQNSNPLIDAVYANPVMMAEDFPPLKYIQKASNILYSIDPSPKYEYQIRRYIEFIQKRQLPTNARIIVSAGGSSQLVSAFYWSVQKILNQPITIKSSIAPPFYSLHKDLAETVYNCSWVNYDEPTSDIIVVVSPNNPNGILQTYPSSASSNTYVLLDSVYDRPQFSNTNTVNPWKFNEYNNPYFCEVNSFSKIGLAGVRIGYAITTNDDIYNNMTNYVSTTTLGTNTWGMFNLEGNLSQCGELYNNNFYRNFYGRLQWRQRQIRSIIPSRLISSELTVPLLFVKVPFEAFLEVGVEVRKGEVFEVSNEYSRINLMISDCDFKELLRRISQINYNEY